MKLQAIALLPLMTLAPAFAQNASDPTKVEGMHFTCNIGSFKLATCKGRAEFEFNGTALVSDLKGTVIPSGNIKVEYNDKTKNRVTYFGKGKLIVEGEWRGIQVFGKGFKGSFKGYGFMLVVGEFDQNLETGKWWWDSAPDKKFVWYTSLTTIQCPPNQAAGPKPQLRGGG